MKKALIVLLICALLVSVCGCSGSKDVPSSDANEPGYTEETDETEEGDVSEDSTAEQETAVTGMSIDEFEAKYQSANWESFLNDPSAFLEDFLSLSSYVSSVSAENNPFGDWEKDEHSSTTLFKDFNLFGKPMKLSVSINESGSGSPYRLGSLRCASGKEDDFDFAKALAQYALETCPDGCEFTVQANQQESTKEHLVELFEGYVVGQFALYIYKQNDTGYDYLFSIYYSAAGANASEPGFAILGYINNL